MHSTCNVMSKCSSPNTFNGGIDSRIMYLSLSVNPPLICQNETQTRSCDNGVWSPWMGTYSHFTCSVFEENDDRKTNISGGEPAAIENSYSAVTFQDDSFTVSIQSDDGAELTQI